MRILAQMSGSSLDGVDLAVIDIASSNQEYSWKVISAITVAYASELKDELSKAYKLSAKDLLEFNSRYAMNQADTINTFLNNNALEVDYISFHGHTIFHEPDRSFTYQLGCGETLHQHTGIPVIGNYRMYDVAKGGQGAPLMAVTDRHLFKEYDFNLNLGGISNISSSINNNHLAFDISPCNQLLNFIAQLDGSDCDRDAYLARNGKLDEKLLLLLNADPYLQKNHPKSLDNNYIREFYLPLLAKATSSLEDRAYTCCLFISSQIASQLSQVNADQKKAKKILSTGGGTLHPELIAMIGDQLSKINVELVIPSKELIEYKELLLMALLAFMRVNNLPNILSMYTGASSDSVAGTIYGQ